jgi:hypothetical protein
MERREVQTWFWWVNLRERQFGRPRLRWVGNMDFEEVGWGAVALVAVAQDRDRLL